MEANASGSRQRDIDLGSGGEHLLYRLMLIVVAPGVTVTFTQPGLTSWWEDVAFAVFTAAVCWFLFRAGCRIGVVSRTGHFSVTNLISTHQVPYHDIDGVSLDWLSLRFHLRSGRHIRVWGLPESFLTARGDRGHELVRRFGAIVEQRARTSAAARHERALSTDWWVFAALMAVFAAAIAYGRTHG